MDNKRIFTFYEPRENISGYLKLCFRSWERFLPDYEIILLDYKNLPNWIDTSLFDNTFYKFSLPVQADVIRCLVLKKHGGLWLDIDTIITNTSIKNILEQSTKHDFLQFNKHLCFIAAKPNSEVLELWNKNIQNNLLFAKNCLKNPLNYIFYRHKLKIFKQWNFLGNNCLNPCLKNISTEKYLSLNAEKHKVFPENLYAIEKSLKFKSWAKKYQYFYFKNDFSEYAIKNNNGIIFLHNSWTPKKYKNMNEKEFLNQNITLSKLLKYALKTN